MTQGNDTILPGSRKENHKGLLITFEGGDGSGKETQTQLTYEWLLGLGLPVKKASFPMYDTPTGHKVAAYLNGELGVDVPAESAGILYRNDRLANIGPIKNWLEGGGIMILNRYAESNSHQAGKLPARSERITFLIENARQEYEENGLPVPDITILFTLAPELAQAYIAKKSTASRANYTTLTHDIHEADVQHLTNANEAFALLPELYPDRVAHISITSEDGQEMLPMDRIQQAVHRAIQPFLTAKSFDTTSITSHQSHDQPA